MRKIILDVDTGIDDALALILAAHLHDKLDVVAVTTVAGNVELPAATDNSRAVLGLVGRADVPVAAGASSPLVRPLRTAPAFHGAGGLGAVDPTKWTSPRAPLAPESAAELIARAAREQDGRLTVIATGPLTNLALALKMDAALAPRIDELVIMGGAIHVPGNASPVAEANFYTDPEAAQIVLTAGIPTVLVPLDVTEQVTIERDELRTFAPRRAPRQPVVAGFAHDVLDFYLGAYETYGRSGAALHDPLAVLVAAHPDLAETETLAIDVATSDPLTAGHCVVDRRPRSAMRPERAPNVRYCRRVNVEACRERILEALFG